MNVSEASAVGTPTIGYDAPGLRDSIPMSGGLVVPVSSEKLGRALVDFFEGKIELTPKIATQSWEEVCVQFIHVPFYCYAYSFGELLVFALVQKYEQEKESFVPKYMDLLSRGGSESPVDLLARMNIDLNDPGFWELGLKLLDSMVTEVEELATQLGK